MTTVNTKIQNYVVENDLKSGDVILYRADICEIEHVSRFVNSEMLAREINAVDKICHETFIDFYMLNNHYELIHIDTLITYINDSNLKDENLIELLNIEFLSNREYKLNTSGSIKYPKID